MKVLLLVPVYLLLLPVMLLVMLPISIVALISIPYFWLYPDRHLQFVDEEGSDAEKASLARWRSAYGRLTFPGRIRHARRRSVKRRESGGQ